ncbi:MAG: hypothetical protein D6723_07220 [Acidobacteria bacterium]|nr:MAG: hypothetical protein D6723_07220 [Acidobacteriota bacterium]
MTLRIVFVILLAMFASNGLAGAAPEPSQEEFVQTLKALRDPVVGPGSELTQQGDYTGTHFAGDGIALSYKPVFQPSSLGLFWDGTLGFGPSRAS